MSCDVLTTYIATLNSKDKLLIMGDFNVASFIHEIANSKAQVSQCLKTEALYNFMYANSLQSHNTVLNGRGSTLDLVLSNVAGIGVQQTYSLVENEDAYHPPLKINIQVQAQCRPENGISKNEEEKTAGRCYSKANFRRMYELVGNKCWEELYELHDVNSAAEYFQQSLRILFPWQKNHHKQNIHRGSQKI